MTNERRRNAGDNWMYVWRADTKESPGFYRPELSWYVFGQSLSAFDAVMGAYALAEEQGNAPYARKTHQSKNNAGDHRVGSAADPGDKVEPENAYAAPVEGADNYENKGYFVHDHG